MPEPVVAPPAAQAGGSAPPAPPSAPSIPSISFGGDQGKPPDAAKPDQGSGAPDTHASDADLKFDFGFEGQEPSGETSDRESDDFGGTELDLSKPFDPALAEKLKDSPELLKAAKRLWYDNRAFRNAGFKTAQEAATYRQDVDTLGASFKRTDGKIGLDAIRAEAGEWEAFNSGFAKGDWGVVKAPFENLTAESADKLIPSALDAYKSKSPQGWARQMAQTFMGELRANNNAGENILRALNDLVSITKDNPEAQKRLQMIGAVVNELDEISRSAPQPQTDPLAAERQKIATEKRGLFVQQLSQRSMPQIQNAAKKAAEVVLRGRNLAPEAMQSFVSEIQSEYVRLSKGDEQFQKNAKAHLDANDADGFERAVRAQIARSMPTAAKNINRKYTGFNSQAMQELKSEGSTRVEGAAGGSSQGAKLRYSGKMVNGGPDPAVIDWGAMRRMRGGNKGAEDMMYSREFMIKGDARNVYFF